ncbi:MAG: AGE family epimerase/isomerase, partial [Methanopyri archaeon]|nr:AGE family epimerase/isomerase [Methanopyri archaeon]
MDGRSRLVLLLLSLLIVPCTAETDVDELYTSDGGQVYLLDNTDPLYRYGTTAFARLAIPHKLIKLEDLGTALTGDRVLILSSYLDTPVIGALKEKRKTMRTFLCNGGFLIVPSQFRGIDGEDVELTYHQSLPGTGDYSFLPVDVKYINSPRASHNHTLDAPLGNLAADEIANTLYGSHGSFEGQGTILNDQDQSVLLLKRFGRGGIILTTFDPDFHTVVDRADWARRLLEEMLLTAIRWEGGGNDEERSELAAFLDTFNTEDFHTSLSADNTVKGEASWEDRALAHLAGLESASVLLPPEVASPYDRLMSGFALVESDPVRAQELVADFQSMETGLRFLRTQVILRTSRSKAVAAPLSVRKEVYETIDALIDETFDAENGGVFSDTSRSVKGLEDQVFAYFTLYEAYLASGDDSYKEAADRTLAFILNLRDEVNGGFRTNGKADGALLDASKKVWDQALVMLVLSHRIFLGECEYADAIGSTMVFLTRLHADNGGYLWLSNDLAGTDRLQAKFLRDH